MAATEKYLITKTDILTYRPTAALDDTRIKPFILEAQRLDLRPVLNDALYYDFVLKFDSTLDPMYASYQKLLVGDQYTYQALTIDYDGIKPMLCFFALARFVASNPFNITRMGVVVKSSDQSDPVDTTQLRTLVNDLRSVAIGYQNEVIKYLENNTSTFALYNTGGASNQAATRTSFNFFKL